MPELPEVETVRRGLQPVMEGRKISRADVNRPDLRWPFPDNMAERLRGRTVKTLRRRSKYILADMDSGETLIIHLGMSGRMQIELAATAQFHQTQPVVQKTRSRGLPHGRRHKNRVQRCPQVWRNGPHGDK